MSKGKVVVLGSNATRIETKGGYWGDTGQYPNETVVPAMALIDAGYEVVLATPNGNPPTIDKAREWASDWQYAGYRMTVFQKSEEKVIEDTILHAKIYFDMPHALGLAGADHRYRAGLRALCRRRSRADHQSEPALGSSDRQALIAALDRKLGHA